MSQQALEEERKWKQRRFRHLNLKYEIKTDMVAEEMQPKRDGIFYIFKKFFIK